MAKQPAPPIPKPVRVQTQYLPKGNSNPKKHLILPDTEVSPFLTQPESTRNQTSKLRWAELDYRLTGKVLHYLKTPGKKDHLQLRSDITSAAIARDKAYSQLQEGPKLHLPTPIIQKICEALQITVNVTQPATNQPIKTEARATANRDEMSLTASSAAQKISTLPNGNTSMLPNSNSSASEQPVDNQPDPLDIDVEPGYE